MSVLEKNCDSLDLEKMKSLVVDVKPGDSDNRERLRLTCISLGYSHMSLFVPMRRME